MTKTVKTKSRPKFKTKVRSKVRPKIKSKFSSKTGYNISTKDMKPGQVKAFLKQQGKYELARAKAGIISPEAMAHRERMAKIKQDTVTKVNTVSQLTGSATALGGSAIASNAVVQSSPSVQVNGGMTNATQGRPSQNDSNSSSNSSSPNGSSDKEWADIIGSLG